MGGGGRLRGGRALGRAPALPSQHALAVPGRAPAGRRPDVPAGARARPRRPGRIVHRPRVRPRDPRVQGHFQPRAVHARDLRRPLRGRGPDRHARPARPDRVGRRLRSGLGRHAGGRHLRGGGGDHRRGQARDAAAHRHAAHELDRRSQQHLPRARDRRGRGRPARGWPAADPPDRAADGGVPRLPIRAQAQRGARVPLRGHSHALALVRDRARARGAARPDRRGVPCRRRRPRPVLGGAEPLGPLVARARRQPAHARADRRAAGREPALPGRRPHRAGRDRAHPRRRPARLLQRARNGDRRRSPAPRRVGLRRAVRHRRTRERGPQLLRGGPAPARDAHRQRDRRAPVRPPRARGAPARVASARARAQGPLRLAHPAGQPLALPQPARARAAHAAARVSASCCSTSTSSRPSTTATATTRATSCCGPSPTACVPACARATPRRALAATSSPCCSTAVGASRRRSPSRSGC